MTSQEPYKEVEVTRVIEPGNRHEVTVLTLAEFKKQCAQVNEAIFNMHWTEVATMLITGQNPIVVTKETE